MKKNTIIYIVLGVVVGGLIVALAIAFHMISDLRNSETQPVVDADTVQTEVVMDQPAVDEAAPQTDAAEAPAEAVADGKKLYVTGDAVRLRVTPDLKGAVHTQVNKGAVLNYVSETGDWYCVNYGGRTLYVSKQFASFTPAAAPAAPAAKPAPKPATNSDKNTGDGTAKGRTLMVTGNGVRLRTGPGESYSVYTKLNKGTLLPYVSTAGEWYCVNYGGRTLYVSKDFVTFNK